MKDENYIVVQGWMINQLKLKGTELFIYAIIYGFTQGDNDGFTGSLTYLADWTNTTRRNVVNSLKSLQERGLITKEKAGKENRNVYRISGEKTSLPEEEIEKKLHTGSEKTSPEVVKKLHMGGEKTSPNNKEISKEISKEKNNGLDDLLNEYLAMVKWKEEEDAKPTVKRPRKSNTENRRSESEALHYSEPRGTTQRNRESHRLTEQGPH